MVKLTSNSAENEESPSSEGESQVLCLQGRNIAQDLCFLLSPVHVPITVVLSQEESPGPDSSRAHGWL